MRHPGGSCQLINPFGAAKVSMTLPENSVHSVDTPLEFQREPKFGHASRADVMGQEELRLQDLQTAAVAQYVGQSS